MSHPIPILYQLQCGLGAGTLKLRVLRELSHPLLVKGCKLQSNTYFINFDSGQFKSCRNISVLPLRCAKWLQRHLIVSYRPNKSSSRYCDIEWRTLLFGCYIVLHLI